MFVFGAECWCWCWCLVVKLPTVLFLAGLGWRRGLALFLRWAAQGNRDGVLGWEWVGNGRARAESAGEGQREKNAYVSLISTIMTVPKWLSPNDHFYFHENTNSSLINGQEYNLSTKVKFGTLLLS